MLKLQEAAGKMRFKDERLQFEHVYARALLLMEVILHHRKSLKSYELQYFRAPRWCKISSINSKILGFHSVWLPQASTLGLRNPQVPHPEPRTP